MASSRQAVWVSNGGRKPELVGIEAFLKIARAHAIWNVPPMDPQEMQFYFSDDGKDLGYSLRARNEIKAGILIPYGGEQKTFHATPGRPIILPYAACIKEEGIQYTVEDAEHKCGPASFAQCAPTEELLRLAKDHLQECLGRENFTEANQRQLNNIGAIAIPNSELTLRGEKVFLKITHNIKPHQHICYWYDDSYWVWRIDKERPGRYVIYLFDRQTGAQLPIPGIPAEFIPWLLEKKVYREQLYADELISKGGYQSAHLALNRVQPILSYFEPSFKENTNKEGYYQLQAYCATCQFLRVKALVGERKYTHALLQYARLGKSLGPVLLQIDADLAPQNSLFRPHPTKAQAFILKTYSKANFEIARMALGIIHRHLDDGDSSNIDIEEKGSYLSMLITTPRFCSQRIITRELCDVFDTVASVTKGMQVSPTNQVLCVRDPVSGSISVRIQKKLFSPNNLGVLTSIMEKIGHAWRVQPDESEIAAKAESKESARIIPCPTCCV